MKLRKTLAMGLAAVCLLGTVSTVSAATQTVTSQKTQGTVKSVSVTPATGVRIYGSALCTTGNALGNIAQWRANMSGDMALAYTIGASSFGHDGSTTDIMSKEYFVRASALRSFSKDASMFTYYSSASTKIYY